MHYEQSSSLSVFIPCTADRCAAHSCVARYVTGAKADTLRRVNESLVTAIPLVRFRVSIPGHCLDAPDRYPLPDLRWWIVARTSAATIRLTAPASHQFRIADGDLQALYRDPQLELIRTSCSRLGFDFYEKLRKCLVTVGWLTDVRRHARCVVSLGASAVVLGVTRNYYFRPTMNWPFTRVWQLLVQCICQVTSAPRKVHPTI